MAARTVGLLFVAVLGVAHAADPPAPERAIVITLSWEGDSPVIEKTDRKEMVFPPQYGFPQLWSRFFELQDRNGDVHYSGPLISPRSLSAPPPGSSAPATLRLVIPDLDEARHLVIYRRISPDPDTGRKIVLEKDL